MSLSPMFDTRSSAQKTTDISNRLVELASNSNFQSRQLDVLIASANYQLILGRERNRLIRGLSAQLDGLAGAINEVSSLLDRISSQLGAMHTSILSIGESLKHPTSTQAMEFEERGRIALSNGWIEEAITDLNESIRIYPYSFTAHYLLGLAINEIGVGVGGHEHRSQVHFENAFKYALPHAQAPVLKDGYQFFANEREQAAIRVACDSICKLFYFSEPQDLESATAKFRERILMLPRPFWGSNNSSEYAWSWIGIEPLSPSESPSELFESLNLLLALIEGDKQMIRIVTRTNPSLVENLAPFCDRESQKLLEETINELYELTFERCLNLMNYALNSVGAGYIISTDDWIEARQTGLNGATRFIKQNCFSTLNQMHRMRESMAAEVAEAGKPLPRPAEPKVPSLVFNLSMSTCLAIAYSKDLNQFHWYSIFVDIGLVGGLLASVYSLINVTGSLLDFRRWSSARRERLKVSEALNYRNGKISPLISAAESHLKMMYVELGMDTVNKMKWLRVPKFSS